MLENSDFLKKIYFLAIMIRYRWRLPGCCYVVVQALFRVFPCGSLVSYWAMSKEHNSNSLWY